ncbi:NADPH oxidase organizer 1-like [Pristis pectinata]|uniref:NADPH oxidase organizer 1-like n=1 Tax=Pristis pectinata TaxID=685728 RepID=UPI00223C8C9C|nr:NADPH oxidase organizer 1-like [Pristis pectinata]
MYKRFPLNVRVIGLMQHKKQKTYLASVLWSDRNDVIVYRAFDEFKKLHKTIVKKYPLEAGRIKKSDRIIPQFQDVSRKEKRHTRVSKSVLRMSILEKYCSELLRCSVKISEDQDVVQFFLPTDNDLAPSFPSDSVIVMPSAVERRKSTWRRTGAKPVQTITQPMASENYKCIATYEGKDTKNNPFKVLEDEIVDVITKNPSGWWLVENERKQLAWFPAPYLRRPLTSFSSENEVDASVDFESQYYAVETYEAKNEDELSMHVGVMVEVLKKSRDGWWLVSYDGQSGYVPSVYLQPYRNPHSKFQRLTKTSVYNSTPNLNLPDKNPHIQSSNADLNNADNYLSTNNTTDARKRLCKQKSISIDCLADRNLFENELGFHNAGQSESRSESLSDDGSASSVSSGKSHVSEDSSSDGFNSSQGSVHMSRLFEKNQNGTSQSTSKHLNLSDEKERELRSIPVASTSENNSNANLIPKIPPRPQREEILSRCTTLTKNMVMKSQNYFGIKNSETKVKITHWENQ